MSHDVIFLAEHMSVFHRVSQDVQMLSDAILKCRRDYSRVWIFPNQNLKTSIMENESS